MLIDESFITLQAGKGGNGIATFFPGKKSGPSGGDGGTGGNIYVRANRSLTSLYKYTQQHLYEAENGEKGGSFNKTGANGQDLILDFPVGTELIDDKTKKVIALPEDGQKILICSGGRGGWGNDKFKSATNRSPMRAENGYPGERRSFKVIMRLIADVGLIGLPNAGKSSLLNQLTKAQARIAPYPFTTLEPNLGALGSIIIADIPGLIEGASSGKGLGIKFLKHIEKVKLLIHCISLEASSEQLLKDYETIRAEIAKFNPELISKPEVVLLTKSDLLPAAERAKKIKKFASKHIATGVSVHDFDALEALKKVLQKELVKS